MDAKRVLWVNAGCASGAGRLPAAWRTTCLVPAEALNELKNNEFHAVVLEFPMPDWTPGELLAEVQRLAPQTPVLLCDLQATVSDAVRLARLGAYQMAEGLPRKTFTGGVLDHLCGYCWPGNVRQLENAVERAIALSGDRPVLAADDFPLAAPVKPRMAVGEMPVVSVPDAGLDYEHTVAVIERSILEQALEKTGGNKKAAAEMLGLKRTTLSAKVRSLAAPVYN